MTVKQNGMALIGSNLENSTKAEIIAYFKWLDYRDSIGNPLVMCGAFLRLLDMATPNVQIEGLADDLEQGDKS